MLLCLQAVGLSGKELYATDSVSTGRVRFHQLAFIDAFDSDDAVLREQTPYRSAPYGSNVLVSEWRDAGYISRKWGFLATDVNEDLSPPHFPATDTPFAEWYQDWCDERGVIE